MDDTLFDHMTPDQRAKAVELALLQAEADLEKAELENFRLREERVTVMATDINFGSFQIVGSITEGMVHNLIGKIEGYRAVCTVEGKTPHVRALVNSAGGSVVDGLALIDYFHQCDKDGVNVTLTGTGEVASMAAVILQSARIRRMTKRSHMLIHEISSQLAGTVSQQDDTRKFVLSLQDKTLDILASRSMLTKARIKSMQARKDVYLDAERALKLGFIDEIVKE